MTAANTHGPMMTDLYELTMAQAYHSAGVADTEACFHLFFRENPFGGGFALAAGLEQAVEWLSSWRFTDEDIRFLKQQTGNDGNPLFKKEFLESLLHLELGCDIDAVPEGTVIFAREPLLRVTGPLPQCQLIETALLNFINFQTLVATKAARCCLAAHGDRVVEFGLRRAQGPDGGLSASRAAWIGGCAGTSNTLAGRVHGVPVAGTHAHSWIMAFDSETEAFEAYAEAMPNNCTFLVDTFDTLQGVRNAVAVGHKLRERGAQLAGIRIDSGDLAWLSRKARDILDDGGFPDARIMASNELDEHLIASLKDQGAAIDVWGVGTKLVTAWDQPALGGVYKLSAIRRPGEAWTPRVKVSEQTAKVTTPGVLGVRRFYDAEGKMSGDMIYDIHHAPVEAATIVDPADAARRKTFAKDTRFQELLAPIFREGRCVWDAPTLSDVRDYAQRSLEELDPTIRRFVNPHSYPVGLEKNLSDLRTALVFRARGVSPEEAAPSASAVAEVDAALHTSAKRTEE